MRTDPPHIDVRQLRYYLAVYDELHFGRAARRLQMAQPPLSQAIRRLEAELGVPLLYRTSRTVAPTEAGVVFAAEAQKVLADLDAAVAEARHAGAGDSALRIGCIPHLPLERLHQIVSAISEAVSSCPLVEHLLTSEQLPRLERGDLDLAIVDDAVDERRDLHVLPLLRGGPINAIVPASHHLAETPAVGPEDLRDEPLVMFPRHVDPSLHDRLLTIFRAGGYRFRRVNHAIGPRRRDILLAVAQGEGVALIPTSAQDLADCSAVLVPRPLTRALFMPDTVIVWRVAAPQRLADSLASIRALASTFYSA